LLSALSSSLIRLHVINQAALTRQLKSFVTFTVFMVELTTTFAWGIVTVLSVNLNNGFFVFSSIKGRISGHRRIRTYLYLHIVDRRMHSSRLRGVDPCHAAMLRANTFM